MRSSDNGAATKGAADMEAPKAMRITPALFVTGLEAGDREEALKLLCERLREEGMIKETFYDSLLERESRFPTGLATKGFGVAIPHTHPEHVSSSGIAVGVLKKPVSFADMMDPEAEVEVSIIFVLALSDASGHIDVMRTLMGLVKREEALRHIQSLTQQQLFEYFDELFENLPSRQPFLKRTEGL